MDTDFDLEKYRSIGVVGRSPSRREIVVREESAIVRTTEHADGRQDVAITPDTARYQAVRHNTGRKRGQVAEIKETKR